MLLNDKKRQEMLEKIMQYRFAVVETTLYLDTHPNDCEIIKRHNHFARKAKELMAEYEKTYGEMLCIYSDSDVVWNWPENFPFDFGKCCAYCKTSEV
ncbi:MAG: spore coat protein CotJB [Eubacteriaceae bacterium]|nr:spore coat protein CotJB [Eubacteriaceae bacterium]